MRRVSPFGGNTNDARMGIGFHLATMDEGGSCMHLSFRGDVPRIFPLSISVSLNSFYIVNYQFASPRDQKDMNDA